MVAGLVLLLIQGQFFDSRNWFCVVIYCNNQPLFWECLSNMTSKYGEEIAYNYYIQDSLLTDRGEVLQSPLVRSTNHLVEKERASFKVSLEPVYGKRNLKSSAVTVSLLSTNIQ